MAEEVKKAQAPKKSWWDGLKSEFRKIIWPDKKDLTKETAAVIVVSVILGAIIAVLDAIMQYGVDILIG